MKKNPTNPTPNHTGSTSNRIRVKPVRPPHSLTLTQHQLTMRLPINRKPSGTLPAIGQPETLKENLLDLEVEFPIRGGCFTDRPQGRREIDAANKGQESRQNKAKEGAKCVAGCDSKGESTGSSETSIDGIVLTTRNSKCETSQRERSTSFNSRPLRPCKLVHSKKLPFKLSQNRARPPFPSELDISGIAEEGAGEAWVTRESYQQLFE